MTSSASPAAIAASQRAVAGATRIRVGRVRGNDVGNALVGQQLERVGHWSAACERLLVSGPMNFCAVCDMSTWTSAPAAVSVRASSADLYAEIEPVTPSRISRPLRSSCAGAPRRRDVGGAARGRAGSTAGRSPSRHEWPSPSHVRRGRQSGVRPWVVRWRRFGRSSPEPGTRSCRRGPGPCRSGWPDGARGQRSRRQVEPNPRQLCSPRRERIEAEAGSGCDRATQRICHPCLRRRTWWQCQCRRLSPARRTAWQRHRHSPGGRCQGR